VSNENIPARRKEKTMRVNLNLKAELIKRFGSQVEAAKAMGIRENRLSYIVRGHILPSEAERKALEYGLGRACVQSLLNGSRQRIEK
jgi:plasmid maintenance system antidote protein VapI